MFVLLLIGIVFYLWLLVFAYFWWFGFIVCWLFGGSVVFVWLCLVGCLCACAWFLRCVFDCIVLVVV